MSNTKIQVGSVHRLNYGLYNRTVLLIESGEYVEVISLDLDTAFIKSTNFQNPRTLDIKIDDLQRAIA